MQKEIVVQTHPLEVPVAGITPASAARSAARPALRARLVEAAWLLGSTEGARAVTIRRVANAVGVSATMLYDHFDGKDALLVALRQSARTRLDDALGESVERSADAFDALFRLSSSYAAFLRTHAWLRQLGEPSGTRTWSEPEDRAPFVRRACELIQANGSTTDAPAAASHLCTALNGAADLSEHAELAGYVRFVIRGLA